ncbi:MAG: hypothetical protein AAF541_12620 [Pseudomonadota bacterium]
MNAYVALIQREFLEHRGAFLWSAGILLALVFIAGLMVLRFDATVADLDRHDREELVEKLGEEGRDVDGLEALVAMGLDAAGSTDGELDRKMQVFMAIIAMPFHWIFIAIAFFGLVACMYDERKDQSVLWWKSMPVSDTATVLSKWAFICLCAPVITTIAVWIAQLYSLTVTMAFVEDGMGGRLWGASGVFTYPFRMLFGYFVYSLWVLPVAAWVMFVATAVPKVPILWAFGLPWSFIVLEGILFESSHLARAIAQHMNPISLPFTDPESYTTIGLFAEPSMWGGLVVGAGLIFGTIWFRGRNNAI